MKHKIPFSLVSSNKLKSLSHFFYGIAKPLEAAFPSLRINLEQARIKIKPLQYISMCLFASLFFFIFISFIAILALFFFDIDNPILIGFSIAIPVSLFVFLQQILYPKLKANKKIRGLEVNLLPALQSIIVQLNSGIPLFDILVNISSEDYGEISKEFRRAVKEINAGRSQVDVLEEMASKNPSLFFRRAIWQLVNGMKAGSDISSVIEEVTSTLSETQLTQIQNYGSQLNPLAMFYMLIAVILPTLGTTFLIIILSFLQSSEFTTKLIFWVLFGTIAFFQLMFLGVIKSRRPALMH